MQQQQQQQQPGGNAVNAAMADPNNVILHMR